LVPEGQNIANERSGWRGNNDRSERSRKDSRHDEGFPAPPYATRAVDT